jgi:hypothetical protein
MASILAPTDIKYEAEEERHMSRLLVILAMPMLEETITDSEPVADICFRLLLALMTNVKAATHRAVAAQIMKTGKYLCCYGLTLAISHFPNMHEAALPMSSLAVLAAWILQSTWPTCCQFTDMLAIAGRLKALLQAKTASRYRGMAAYNLMCCLTCINHLTAETVKKNNSLFARSHIFSKFGLLC